MDKLIDNIKKGFSVAMEEAEKLTKTVAGKTTNIVDVTKLNLALSDTERKISALEQKIGEMVYAKYEEDSACCDEFSELCSEIKEFKTEQNAIKEQIAALKNAIPCPECGSLNDRENSFCIKCGAKLSEKKAENEDKVIEVTEFTED